MSYVVMLDAGHGGWDPGATYYGRQEKNDNLNLALAVGNILEQKGIPVIYTRTSDVYQTPFEKAEMANRSDADFFVSFHRNAMPVPGTASESRAWCMKIPGRRQCWRKISTRS